jgi:hypothetical protein
MCTLSPKWPGTTATMNGSKQPSKSLNPFWLHSWQPSVPKLPLSFTRLSRPNSTTS